MNRRIRKQVHRSTGYYRSGTIVGAGNLERCRTLTDIRHPATSGGMEETAIAVEDVERTSTATPRTGLQCDRHVVGPSTGRPVHPQGLRPTYGLDVVEIRSPTIP